jgi:site-specific DNA recombinase
VYFSRHRYGKEVCAADRLPAGQVEDGVLAALLETFADTDLGAGAARLSLGRAGDERDRQAEEFASIARKEEELQESVDRYMRAFETRALPESVCGDRVRALAAQLADLQEHRYELAQRTETAPTLPAEEDIEALKNQIGQALALDEPGAKKALFEAVVHEIRVVGRHEIKPYFRIPRRGAEDLRGGEDMKVRDLSGSAGPAGVEPAFGRFWRPGAYPLAQPLGVVLVGVTSFRMRWFGGAGKGFTGRPRS